MVNILRLTSALRLTPEPQNSTICSQELKQKSSQTDSMTNLDKASFSLSHISNEISGKIQIKLFLEAAQAPGGRGKIPTHLRS